MKIVCDSCSAQYMVADEKVGPAGVKVRCKRCGHTIIARRIPEPDPTVVMQSPLAQPPGIPREKLGGNVQLDDVAQAFDRAIGNGASDPDVTNPGLPAGGGPGVSTSLSDPSNPSNPSNPAALPEGLQARAALEAASRGKGSESLARDEWYVAIDDEQRGPLDLHDVEKHWSEGRLDDDSLVWRPGYPDWKPISAIAPLAKRMESLPKKKARKVDAEPPAGAVAIGMQVAKSPSRPPSASALSSASPVPDGEEIDWKPQAAAALASLVAEEMESLAKPAPKKAEPAPSPSALGDLLDLPAAPPEAASAAPAELAASPSSPAPAPAAARPPTAAGAAKPISKPAPIARNSSLPEVPAYPGSGGGGYVPPPPERSDAVKYGVFGLLGIGTLAVIVYVAQLAFRPPPAPVAVVTPPPVAVAVVEKPIEKPAEPVAVAPTPAPTPAPEAVVDAGATVVAQAEPPKADPTPEPKAEATPEKKPETKLAGSSKSAGSSSEGKKSKKERDREAREEKKRLAEEKKASELAAKAEAKAKADEAKHASEPAPRVATSDADLLGVAPKSKLDQDFDRLLGGGGEKKKPGKEDEERKPVAKAAPYVPPPVENDLPDQLGKGDIMGVVAGHKDQIKQCVKEQKASDPDSSGSVVMAWSIAKDGSVSGVKCKTDEFRQDPIASCLSKQIGSWTFPKFKGAAMPIDFPFKF